MAKYRERLQAMLWAGALAVSVLAGAGSGNAAERRIVPAPDFDYYGHDYDVLRDADANLCETACLSDTQCKAFTLNVSTGWCFLKSAVGPARQTPGAMSGRIVDAGPEPDAAAMAAREASLDFLPSSLVDDARRLRLQLQGEALGTTQTPQELLSTARTASDEAGPAAAIEAYRRYLGVAPGDASAWRALAESALDDKPEDWDRRRAVEALRAQAAISAYVTAPDDAEAAAALDLLAQAQGEDENWRGAIRTWRAATALGADPQIAQRLEDALTDHGFRVTGNSVDNDAASPRICMNFSDELSPSLIGSDRAGDYLSVDGGDALPVTASGRQLCVDGVEHGRRYRVKARAGIPSAHGEVLRKDAEGIVYVRDRTASAFFAGNAYVLPSGGAVSLPVTSVNADEISLRLLRLGDRQLARSLGDNQLLTRLGSYQLDDIAANSGEEVWTGTVSVANRLNQDTVTAIPLADVLKESKPGIYLLAATPSNGNAARDEPALQWFVLTDLGLSTLSGADGFHVTVRSLGRADALAGITLQLIAANNDILATATTDADGHATFAPGLLAGTGGDRPALLTAERGGSEPDFVFLDLTTSGFDLSDRGVAGRAPADALDVFLTPERGIYRPGETIHLTALVRDADARAVDGAVLTMIVRRPDGVEYLRRVVSPRDAGGTAQDVDLPAGAMRGSWHVALHIDPERPALASTDVQVQDFEPQKIAFDVDPVAQFDPSAPPDVSLKARYLFGAPAAGLAVEGEVVLSAAQSLAARPGYVFGLSDEEVTPLRVPFEGTQTDAEGVAGIGLSPFEPPATTRPVSAELIVRVLDSGGRPVERRQTVPVAAEGTRIGIRPDFDGEVPEGGTAGFSVIALGAADATLPQTGLRWVLNRIDTEFQWYQSGGQWNYEPIRRSERVADGMLDLPADGSGKISAPVGWGRYELLVSGEGVIPASIGFDAGWYVAATAADTPEIAEVSLDKPRYAVGEEAIVHVVPRFAGKADILVLGESLIDRVSVDLPADGADIRLPVTQAWGSGAYVAAMIYRPMDLEQRRMPGRAIGLSHAAVDPGARDLQVSIEAPEVMTPRQSIEVPVRVAGLAAGTRAYVTLSAVDVGILNITDFAAPAPSHYYFGQRRLGVAIRDLYSRLIDRMQGALGAVRSGGDAGADAVSPPPMDQLVALYSGIVETDAQGVARVELAIPDFNGTLKLMAMAWTQDGVGQADRDLVVRDPIVAELVRPRFLAPGDSSRIVVELAHVDGPSGKVALALTGGEGVLEVEASPTTTVDLPAEGRARYTIPVRAAAPGLAELTLTVTPPDGGAALEKHVSMEVRSLRPQAVARSSFPLAPGRGITLDDTIFAQFSAAGASATLSVTSLSGFDVAGAVRALDLYPYGCTEQLTSRALPMVYLDETVLAAGLGSGVDVRARVQEAITKVLANQGSGGSFGLWAPDYGDLWLDAYVTDFLTRAAEADYAVPREALTMALDNLANQVSYQQEHSDWAPASYASYVLARSGRAAIGDLRYVADNKLSEFRSPLAKAQLAAALAIYNDRVRAETVYRDAVRSMLGQQGDADAFRHYGSALRDSAAMLTLGLEGDIPGTDLQPLIQKISAERSGRTYLSTQEDAWSLLAAHAMVTARTPRLELDGEIREGAYATRFTASDLAQPATIRNAGQEPLSADLTLRGVPTEPLPADASGYAISRSYYTLEGEPADLERVSQGDRLVAVLDVQPVDRNAARLVIDDPLPAGFEIDNPAILRGGDVAALDFLELTDDVAHTEFRTERFIVAVDLSENDTAAMRFAYVVRAVSPGSFMHPAAVVENMYQPERRGRTGESRLVVAGTAE
ncbi:alpha-2-macroglobulin family protein [Aureimonas frigidaquae]|uniref:alpha-2-macroglobulin family protein n=1 Tax=Aureimonas frigidaquae TaxID=424757 RepID=UPI0007866515|nr:alpha-2-macroglobulin family protein [Aureimonas frigidaquae]